MSESKKETLMRTYSELVKLTSFDERFRYLKLNGSPGEATFGYDRYLNQQFYTSPLWKRIRREVILRDMGYDLGIKDREIVGKILVHHLNPITVDDIVNQTDRLLDPENLISVSKRTHDAIHFGDESILEVDRLVVRKPGDTCPWR